MLSENFKAHDLWALLDEIEENVSAVLAEKPELDETQKHVLRKRLPLVIGAIKAHQHNSSVYYSTYQLNEMEHAWDSVATDVLNIVEQNANSTAALTKSIDNVYAVAASWPDAYTFRGGAARKAEATYEQAQNTLIARMEGLEGRLREKDAELEAQATKHASEMDQLSQQLEELKESITQSQSDVQNQTEKISELTVKHNQTFDEGQQRRRDEWEEWLINRKEEYDAEAEQEIAALSNVKTSSEDTLQEIKKVHSQVEKAAGNAVSAVLAKDHNRYSLRDYATGWLMLLLGLGLSGLAVTSLIGSIGAVSPDTPVSWQWASLKITVTLLISAGATFILTMAKGFFDKSAETKRLELELRTIHPFLSEIQDTDLTNNTKVDFIKRTFGQQTQDPDSKAVDEATDNERKRKLDLLVSLPEAVITALKNNGQQ